MEAADYMSRSYTQGYQYASEASEGDIRSSIQQTYFIGGHHQLQQTIHCIPFYLSHMMSEAGTSIIEAAVACFGQRISMILLQSGDKDKNYITSLHNEVVSIILVPISALCVHI